MKQCAAILLLSILLFNSFGYKLLTRRMQNRATRELEARLDKHLYNPGDLVAFKMAIHHMAYYNSSAWFERVSGQVNIGGVQYRYVERRIFGDSLELRCIPDKEAMQWETRNSDFFKLVNGLQHPGQNREDSRRSAAIRDIASEYFSFIQSFIFNSPQTRLLSVIPGQPDPLPEGVTGFPDRPPEVLV